MPACLPPILQPGHNNRSILHDTPIRTLPLHHEIRRKAQLPATGHIRASKGALHLLGIICDDGDVVPAGHEFLGVLRGAVDVVREDLHHVFFRIGRGAGRAPRAVGGDVERLVVVQELEDVIGRRGVDDGRGDKLIHRFVVGGMGGVVHETCTAGVHGAAEESKAYAPALGYAG